MLLLKLGSGTAAIEVTTMTSVVEGRTEVGVAVDELKKDEIDTSVDVKCEDSMGSTGWADDVGRG